MLAYMIRPEFVYRHRWCEGDLLIWDNCSAIHLAIPDFAADNRRRMHRTTILYEDSIEQGKLAT